MKPGRKVTVAKSVTFIKPKPKAKKHPTKKHVQYLAPELDPYDLVEDEVTTMAKTADDEPEVNPTGPAVPPGPSAKDRLSSFTDMLTMQYVHAGPVAPHMLQELRTIMGML